MPALLFIAVTLVSLVAAPVLAAEPEIPAKPDDADYTQYNLQRITAKPGKLDQIHTWLRAHQDDVLAKYGATNIAYLVPVGDNPDGKLVCIYRYPSLEDRVKCSRACRTDPSWKPMDPEGKTPEGLIEKVESVAFRPLSYSPKFAPTKSPEPRVFELRTYTCPSPEKLFYLHERFRDHTMKLFEKHGMENLIYWSPMDMDDSDRKLVYLLAHKSVEAAKESFANFRKDPDWLAAREASEKKAGGSLTEKEGGVVSEFFVATDYSPLK